MHFNKYFVSFRSIYGHYIFIIYVDKIIVSTSKNLFAWLQTVTNIKIHKFE